MGLSGSKQKVAQNTVVIVTAENSCDILWSEEKECKGNENEGDYGKGYVMKHNGEYYIITCYHVIKNAKEIIALHIDNKKTYCIKLVVGTTSTEFDVAILKATGKIDNVFTNPLNINDFNFVVPEKNSKVEIIDIYVNDEQKKKQTTVAPFLIDDVVIEDSLICGLPKTVLINLSKKGNKNIIVNGSSGSLCICDEKIIGMVSCSQDGKIQLVPMYIVFRVLKEFMKKKKWCGVCSLLVNYKTNKKGETYITDVLRNSKFKKGDIIKKINGTKVHDGYIFIEKMQYNVPIDTFIGINCIKDYKINILVNRKGEDMDIVVKGKPIAKYMSVPYNPNNCNVIESITVKGYTFANLTYELLKYFDNKGIHLCCKYLDFEWHSIFKNKRKVVLVNNNNCLICPVLRHIDGKKVNDVEDVKNAINMNFDFE